jgi:hypothetical protein
MIMKRALVLALAALVGGMALGGPLGAAAQETSAEKPAQAATNVQPVSWEKWLTAKAKAEESDASGDYVAALQYYLEYTRQAQGLGSAIRVAWGKNNAAYMIIKMHRQDPTVDLAPAQKLLEEGLAIAEATDDCKRVMTANLEYVKLSLR